MFVSKFFVFVLPLDPHACSPAETPETAKLESPISGIK
jgi:hypothetical protein